MSAPLAIRVLGTTTFPAPTRSLAAQTTFVRGLPKSKLFEQDCAVTDFRQAEQLAPDYAALHMQGGGDFLEFAPLGPS